VETGSTLVRVVPGPTGRWEVREPGSSRALFEADSPVIAAARARRLLTGGGTVEVLDQAGRVLESQTAPSASVGRPWWYVPPTKLNWVLGALFAAQGVFHLIAGVRWLSWLFLLMAAVYLIALTASRRRDSRIGQWPPSR
jgi:hypothetical protein